MSHEAQLQSIVSWAIPRHVEKWNSDHRDRPPCAWAGYVPANANQSVINPATFGWDFLLMLGCEVAALLELKYVDRGANGEAGPAFNTGQHEYLQWLEQHMLVRVCFNAEREIIHRIAPPDAGEAHRVLSRIRAVKPSELAKDDGQNVDNTLATLIDDLLAYAGGGGRQLAGIAPAGWEQLAGDILALYESGSAPPNLLFAMAGQNRLSVVRGESAGLVLKFLASRAYEQLKVPVKALGKAYLDCLKNSHSATEEVSRKFDEAIAILVGLVEQFSFAPRQPAWKDARDKALGALTALAAEAELALNPPAGKPAGTSPKRGQN